MDPDKPEEEGEEGAPFLYSPNIIDDDVRNGLICFLSEDRQCGADCMAYMEESFDVPNFNEQQGRCALLINLERAGKHLVILASLISGATEESRRAAMDARKKAQDAERESRNKEPIPDPMGGTL